MTDWSNAKLSFAFLIVQKKTDHHDDYDQEHASRHRLTSMVMISKHRDHALSVGTHRLRNGLCQRDIRYIGDAGDPRGSAIRTTASNNPRSSTTTTSSRIWNLADVSPTSTAHGTSKRQFIAPFQVHSSLAGVSMASLRPGERIERHVHPTMHEFMYVVQGRMRVTFETAAVASMSKQSQPAAAAAKRMRHGVPVSRRTQRAALLSRGRRDGGPVSRLSTTHDDRRRIHTRGWETEDDEMMMNHGPTATHAARQVSRKRTSGCCT